MGNKNKGLKIFLILMTITLSAVLCGCGATLDLTDEEIDRVVNYSANVLQKYNSHGKSTLADVSDTSLAVLLEEEDIHAAEEARRAARHEKRKQEAENSEDGEDKNSEVGSNGNPLIDENASEFTSLSDILGLNGFSIDYKGYDIADSYPESVSENDLMFGIDAGNGDKLLILNFDIRNTGAQSARCSVMDRNPSFKLKINGDRHSFLKTLLMDDLATFDEDMEGGEVKGAVLVAEISEAKASAVQTIVLTLKNQNGENQMILEGSGAGAVDTDSEAAQTQAVAEDMDSSQDFSEDSSDDGISEEDMEAFGEEFGDVLEEGEDGSLNGTSGDNED